MPDLANGFPIIASSPTPRDHATRAGRVILVERIHNPYDPWVTAWLGDGDTSWCWGHYFADPEDAKQDYAERVKRGY